MTKEEIEEETIKYLNDNIEYFKKEIKLIEILDSEEYDEELEDFENKVKHFKRILTIIEEKNEEIKYLKEKIKLREDLYKRRINEYITLEKSIRN